MNPWDLSASDLMVWGLIAHLIADWPFQNDWMARNKAKVGHPAGVVHASIHAAALALVFGWAAAPLALAHYLIDLRKPVAWWSRLVGQTQPEGAYVRAQFGGEPQGRRRPLYDVGTEVRFWTDQVFHVACLAAAALLVG